jgi:ABC-type protease/lipase transport system fused ATPase/permease subunit
MVRYFYVWPPLVIVAGTAVLVASPYLALIALMIVALGVLAALAWAIVWAPLLLSRAISRRRHGDASPRTAAALSPATSVARRARSMPAAATVLLASPPSERHM